MRPKDITQAVHRPPRWEGWIPTHTGNGFFVINPKAEEVRIEDVAYGLAYKYRYGGQVEPITIAEHSILVSLIIEILWPKSKKMMAGLFHDACVAYTYDIQAPVRKFVKVQMPNGELMDWRDLERKINQVVGRALGLDRYYWTAEEVQAADILALALEKAQCPSIKDRNWGLPPIPSEVEHLKVRCDTPDVAFKMFLDRMESLR